MNPWVDTLLVAMMSGILALAAYKAVRVRNVCIVVGIVAIIMMLFVGVALRRREFAIVFSAAIPITTAPLLTFQLSRFAKAGLALAASIAVIHSGWGEFLAPALARTELAEISTTMKNEVCLQSTGYTCGPAAAVTRLRRLGLPAEESQIAILAKSSEFTGTDAPLLVDAIEKSFPGSGIRCEITDFESIEDLKRAPEPLTVVNLDSWTDHWVVVLEITETHVKTADPIHGIHIESRASFEQRWQKESIIISR